MQQLSLRGVQLRRVTESSQWVFDQFLQNI